MLAGQSTSSSASTPTATPSRRHRRSRHRRGRGAPALQHRRHGLQRALAFAVLHAPGRRVWAVEGSGSYGAGLTTFLLETQRGSSRSTGRPAGPARRREKRHSTPSAPPGKPCHVSIGRTPGPGDRKRSGPVRRAARRGRRPHQGDRTTQGADVNAPEHCGSSCGTAPPTSNSTAAPGCAPCPPQRRTPRHRLRDPRHRPPRPVPRGRSRRARNRPGTARDGHLPRTARPTRHRRHHRGPVPHLLVPHRPDPQRSRLRRPRRRRPHPRQQRNTVRHRLNRNGDRQLNRALHTVALSRLQHHAPTRAYAARRTAEGKSSRDIKRCLKRAIAREIYRHLQAHAQTAKQSKRPLDRHRSILLIALGTAAAEAGRRVRYLTCATLVNELAEAADDKPLPRPRPLRPPRPALPRRDRLHQPGSARRRTAVPDHHRQKRNAPPSPAPPTPPSPNGATPSPTPASPPPSSTGSPSTPTSSKPAPAATGSPPAETGKEPPTSNQTQGGAKSAQHSGAKSTCHSHPAAGIAQRIWGGPV